MELQKLIEINCFQKQFLIQRQLGIRFAVTVVLIIIIIASIRWEEFKSVNSKKSWKNFEIEQLRVLERFELALE